MCDASDFAVGTILGQKVDKKMNYSGKRKGGPKVSGPKWPETAGQDMDDSMIPRPYGIQERIRILRRMQFMSMRYPHKETIRELGIEEDVNDILYYTSLETSRS
ncbi:unnamed protein product [Microthlaspi erraticum]|uniref:Arabidopsis retrotransposon Orf1 C-terminal domain-containing protein n=1 Tax=Microthlaspi erraticum TaxID=1685480 RepID=A0A6D2IPV9_9BRAS|nr:unnamed protein product [Microthlaspi erraticum]